MVVRVGAKWGFLTCIGVESKVVETKSGAYSYEQAVAFYQLACKCGKVVEVDSRTFGGKRAVRDCGCGLAFKGESSPTPLYLPVRMIERLKVRAAKLTAGNVSLLAVHVLTSALEKPVEVTPREASRVYTITLPTALKAKVGEAARKDGVSIGMWIRKTLEREIKQ